MHKYNELGDNLKPTAPNKSPTVKRIPRPRMNKPLQTSDNGNYGIWPENATPTIPRTSFATYNFENQSNWSSWPGIDD